MPDFSDISGIGVAGLSVFLFWKLASNHIHHNTDAIMKLAEVLKEIKGFLEHGKIK